MYENPVNKIGYILKDNYSLQGKSMRDVQPLDIVT